MIRFDRLFGPVLDFVFPPRPTELLVRNLSDDALIGFLEPEARTLSACSATALLPYDEVPVRACIVEAKFHGNERAAALLARAAVEYLSAELTEQDAFAHMPTVIVPVPLSQTRLRERGYNQVERVANRMAEMMENLSVETDLLMRVRDTRPQTELDGFVRKQNVRGAFAAIRTLEVRARYVLIDDVMTTGATMQEAVRALRNSGARRIMAVALAH